MMEVINAGAYCAIQDFGRSGYAHLGVGKSGAIDTLSLHLANRLVGNPSQTPAIEIALITAAEFQFNQDCWIAVTGSLCNIFIDHTKQVAHGWRIFIQKGQRVKIKPMQQSGLYCYLAVSGGIIAEPVLGSISTDIKNHLGGLNGDGSRLKAGDHIQLNDSYTNFSHSIGIRSFNKEFLANKIFVLKGPEFEEFTEESQQNFVNQSWEVSSHSNRMGIRLMGESLTRSTTSDLLSQGVFEGVIQVPPNGQPLILTAECQSTGGYPRIAVIPQAELWKLAYLPMRNHLRFEFIDEQEAQAKLQTQKKYLQHIEYMLSLANAEENSNV